MGVYMLTYEHVCGILKKLSYFETRTAITEKESMPRYIQIFSGGIAGNYTNI